MAITKYKDADGNWQNINVKVMDTLPLGSVVEYDGASVPNGWEEVEDLVLWENKISTDALDAQTILLSTSDYEYYEIFYKVSSLHFVGYKTTGKIPKGHSISLDGSLFNPSESRIINTVRNITVSPTNMVLSNAYLWKSDYEGQDNRFCIPIKIIGYK